VFGSYSEILVAILAMIVCIGTLNAWILASGQIAKGAANDHLLPKIFGKTNKIGAPVFALLFASFGIVPFFIAEQKWGEAGLNRLVELLVCIFLLVYIICCIAYIKMVKQWKSEKTDIWKAYILSIAAILFCVFVVAQDILNTIVVTLIFVVIGIPVYLKVSKTWKNNRPSTKLATNISK
jgi:APA family basic amino acid/polyamine antiporter